MPIDSPMLIPTHIHAQVSLERRLILVTTTYASSFQYAMLTYLVGLLSPLTNYIWIVAEDAATTNSTIRSLLNASGLPHVYLACGPTRRKAHRGSHRPCMCTMHATSCVYASVLLCSFYTQSCIRYAFDASLRSRRACTVCALYVHCMCYTQARAMRNGTWRSGTYATCAWMGSCTTWTMITHMPHRCGPS